MVLCFCRPWNRRLLKSGKVLSTAATTYRFQCDKNESVQISMVSSASLKVLRVSLTSGEEAQSQRREGETAG